MAQPSPEDENKQRLCYCVQAPKAMPTFPPLQNATLPGPYLPISGCMLYDDAVDLCSRYYDASTKNSCAGFFFVQDDSCKDGKRRYNFGNEFNPQHAGHAFDLGDTIGESNRITPTAVQLRFHIQPN